MGGLPHNFRKLSSHSVIRNGQLLCGGPPEPSPVPAPAPPTPRARTLPPTTPIPTTTPEATPTQTPVPPTRGSPLHPQKCGGTFVGSDGSTYTCQHAIDNGWARNCAVVSGWTNAQCFVDMAVPVKPTPPAPTRVAATAQVSPDPCSASSPWQGERRLVSVEGFSLEGLTIRSDACLEMCKDCATRCWLQTLGCVGFAWERPPSCGRLGKCTYYSRIDNVVPSAGVTAVTTVSTIIS